MGIIMNITSNRTDTIYRVDKFTEYNIDLDLEMDTDQFDMVIENPNGMYSGIFNKFDAIDILSGNSGVMVGTIDNVEYIWDDSGDYIQLSGRDIMSIFVDNDALPSTKNNVKPDVYIASKCKEYGIARYKLDGSLPVVKKLIIGTNESEVSIMNNILIDSRKRLWLSYDTVYMGDWNTGAQPVLRFTRGVPQNQAGIAIKSLRLRDSGTDMKSEVRIYGSMNDGTEKVVGTAKNDSMIQQGIRRRAVMRSSNDDSSSKYASNALRHIRDGFRDGIELQIDIRTGDDIIMPNMTAIVIDSVTKINSTFLIKNVTYRRSDRLGSITSIRMIPGDTTFDVLWNTYGNKTSGRITGLPSMSIGELLSTRK